METTHPAPINLELPSTASAHTLGVFRVALTLGVSAAVIFGLCWIGSLLPFSSPTHAYVSLFTTAEISSVRALAEGTFWSLVFGMLAGAVISSFYNAFTRLQPR